MAAKLSLLTATLFSFRTELPPDSSKIPIAASSSSPPVFHASHNYPTPTKSTRTTGGFVKCSSTAAQAESEVEVEVADGYTITQFCDKIIDVFLNEKPKSKEWKRYLVFRDEWNKYRDRFYHRCSMRADAEIDSQMKHKLIDLSRKVRKLFEFISKRSMNSFDCAAYARLGARCLAAVSAFDNTLEIVGTLDTAQAKFDDILNSPSVDIACEKIKSLAKAKELDSSLILLINGAWGSAKESPTMKNEVKDIMYRLYKATQSSLRSIAPKEIKLLKYLLNITDPEERFSALATAFSPGDERDIKEANDIYTTPKELHKWIKIMVDAYHLNKEETEIREAKKMNQPVVIQRLFILKETIEEEYLEKNTKTETDENSED
ncbi:hypothetical protein BUALT_Bualt04G0092300 [Buddleja alternifolia]|uniref:Uncharacterized protein n=1 Tax=Buddleja alternifolia TaxID=168488 RepID=A0AAV6XYA0_9LAMI|nr:hypothetical protein BUALT_Bualt04G0092300 [Buddleja alternifolia]